MTLRPEYLREIKAFGEEPRRELNFSGEGGEKVPNARTTKPPTTYIQSLVLVCLVAGNQDREASRKVASLH